MSFYCWHSCNRLWWRFVLKEEQWIQIYLTYNLNPAGGGKWPPEVGMVAVELLATLRHEDLKRSLRSGEPSRSVVLWLSSSDQVQPLHTMASNQRPIYARSYSYLNGKLESWPSWELWYADKCICIPYFYLKAIVHWCQIMHWYF